MKHTLSFLFALSVLSVAAGAGFPLIENGVCPRVWYPGNDAVVETALDMLYEDSELVASTPVERVDYVWDRTVIVGICGQEPVFDSLLGSYGIEVTGLAGTWEGYTIREVEHGGERLLFVAGSDPRGTAYGVLELSRAMGVSPWVWWADVIPDKVSNLVYVPDNKIKAPSVQYRGIFINDEDWGFMPWSTGTFEPTETPGAIGPKTYGRVCELLLRLRANTLWPAMHECTVPFYMVPGNKDVAHKYGIIVGTSHCEPMMRTNTGEWDDARYGPYNFITNRDNVLSYWAERLREVAPTENIYTLGMRGVHDGRMQGVASLDEETAVLQEVIAAQRRLLSEHNEGPVETVPQVFIPYKEVLNAYENGLEVPDDVTLVWCDDNHGHITRLSDEREQRRSGGSGIYYHVSYWGKPHDYLWLATTQPALIYTEMKRAWDHGARRIWILNAGDIKPAEYLTEFFLDLAWDIESVGDGTVGEHRRRWFGNIYGEEAGDKIDAVMREYYRLAAHRKPEHMGWSRVEDRTFPRGLSPVADTEFSPYYFNDEVYRRMEDYMNLSLLSGEVYGELPEPLSHSYFQLVYYPVAGSWLLNQKLLAAQLARMYEHTSPAVAAHYARSAGEAYEDIRNFDRYYNDLFSGGKWKGMMDHNPRNLPVFGPPVVPAGFDTTRQEYLVWAENDTVPVSGVIRLEFTAGTGEKRLVKFHTGDGPQGGSITIQGTSRVGAEIVGLVVPGEVVIEFSMREFRDPDGVSEDVPVIVIIGEAECRVEYTVRELPEGVDPKYAERNGMIALDAADYTGGGDFSVVDGLGHSGRAVRLPATGDPGAGQPCLGYDIYTFSSGEAVLKVGMVPIHPAGGGNLRYAVQVDDGPVEVRSIAEKFLSPGWSENVLRNQSLTRVGVVIGEPGRHTIKVWALDEELFVDELMLDFEPEREHYLIPTDRSLQSVLAGQK